MEKMKTDEKGVNSVNENEEERKILCLSKEMLPCKLLFLTMDICFTSAFAFNMLFYKDGGLTLTQIGLGKGIVDVIGVLSNTIWGGFLDSITKCRTLLFTSLSLAAAFFTLFTPWLLMFVSKINMVEHCSGNSTHANTTINHTTDTNCTSVKQLENVNEVFVVMTSYGVVASIINGGLYCFIEGTVIKAVFSSKTQQSYGQQKMFGPIGNAFGNFIAGVVVDLYRPKHLPRFSGAYFISIPFCLFIIPLLHIITKKTNKNMKDEDKREDTSEKHSFLQNLKTVFIKKPENCVFIFSVFIAGLSFTIYCNFMFVYMYDVINTTKTMMSMTTVISTLSELVIYPFSSRIITFIGGPLRSIALCLFVYSIRLVLLSVSSTTWFILSIQVLHGFSTSLSWTAMVEQSWNIFPKDATNTAIGILISVHWTCSSIIGNIVGGFLYSRFQGYRLFRGMALVSLSWGLFMLLYFEIFRKEKENQGSMGSNGDVDIEMEQSD